MLILQLTLYLHCLKDIPSLYYLSTGSSSLYTQLFLDIINPFNAELNPPRHLLALVEAHRILHFNRVRVKTWRQKVVLRSVKVQSMYILHGTIPQQLLNDTRRCSHLCITSYAYM
jgi:hypothetical protein